MIFFISSISFAQALKTLIRLYKISRYPNNYRIQHKKNTSTEIAMSHNTSIENSESSTALTTSGFPIVSVPVLSNTIVFTCIEVENNE